jgi:hypothetical protein
MLSIFKAIVILIHNARMAITQSKYSEHLIGRPSSLHFSDETFRRGDGSRMLNSVSQFEFFHVIVINHGPKGQNMTTGGRISVAGVCTAADARTVSRGAFCDENSTQAA